MALRIRRDGRVLCAAMHLEEPGDTYLDDGIHYYLSVEHGILVTESWDGGHSVHGEWWWRGNVPEGVVIDDLEQPKRLEIKVRTRRLAASVKSMVDFQDYWERHGGVGGS